MSSRTLLRRFKINFLLLSHHFQFFCLSSPFSNLSIIAKNLKSSTTKALQYLADSIFQYRFHCQMYHRLQYIYFSSFVNFFFPSSVFYWIHQSILQYQNQNLINTLAVLQSCKFVYQYDYVSLDYFRRISQFFQHYSALFQFE